MAQLISGTTIAGHTAIHAGNLSAHSIATTTYVTTQINNLINGAPGALDTLDELAAALGDDASFATTITNSIASKLALSGGNMTGNINWGATNQGITWNMNTDGAYIKFFNTGDGDTDSRLEYATSDNGDEYHRWLVGGTEEMTLKGDGLRVANTIYASGGNSGNWNTAYGWGNHASAGYITSVVTSLGYTPVTNARTLTINGTSYDLTANRSWSVGTVTSVGGTGTVSGLTLSGTVTGSGNLTLGGTLSLTSSNVTSALGYTPYNSTNPNSYITNTNSYYYVNAGAGYGVGFWNSAPETYGITMGTTGTYGSIYNNSEYYLVLSMLNGGGRGVMFRSDNGIYFQVTGGGDLFTRSAIYPGYNNSAVGGQSTYYIYANTDNAGLRTNGSWLVNGNIYWGNQGVWLTDWLNQNVKTNASPSFNELYIDGRYSRFGASANWDAGSLNGQNSTITNVHFQGHQDFWIGAGNTQWYTSAISGHHDLLINTMQSGGSNIRGITFTASAGGSSVYRLGRWHSGTTSTTSYLNLENRLAVGIASYAYSLPSSTVYIKGSTDGGDVLAVDGVNGRLFTVTDSVLDTIYSVNTIAGLPILEIGANSSVKIGKYGANSITISNSRIAINSDTVDTNFPFYVSDRSTAASRYTLANPGMGFNLADNYAQLQLYGPSGAYIDFVTGANDYNGRIIWSSGAFAVTGNMSWGGATLSGAVWNGTAISDSYISSASTWNTAYNKRPTAISFSGSSTKTLTLTQGDGSTLTASFSDIDTDTNTDAQTLSLSGNTLSISGGNSVTLSSSGMSEATANGRYLYYRGTNLETDFQRFQDSAGEVRFDQINNTGNLSNAPGGYTYGGVLSMRGDNMGFQLWGSHTGDFYFKTQWSDDQYSGWRRVMDATAYPYPANMNQYVRTSDSPSFVNVYASSDLRGADVYTTGGWFRNHTNTNGIYWSSTGWHLMPYDSSDFRMHSGSAGAVAIRMETNGTVRGYLYANSSNEIGLLNQDRSWRFRVTSGGDAYVSGYLYVNGAGTSSSIFMADSDEGQREIHCNSNQIGFLTQAGSWGAYLDDSNNWYAAGSMRAPIFYDSNDTTYYGDFASTSWLRHLSVGDVNAANDSGWNARLNLTGSSHARLDVKSNSDGIITTMYSHTGQGVGRVGTMSNHPLVFMVNGGIAGYAYANYLQGVDSVRAPIFYDSNDTGYYLDPNGTSNLSTVRSYSYQGNANVAGTGSASYHPSGIYSTGTNWLYGTMYLNGNDIYDVNSVRAYYFYDRSDTGYYTRPSGTNRLANIYANYIGVGQDINTSYRLITSGDMYANAAGNIWAEGRFKQYRGSGTWHDVIDSGNIGSQSVSSATRTSGQGGYPHPGTGMWAFYNWGGNNGGASAPTDSSYTIGIAVGSHPSDQAYGFQIGRNMWNTGLWTRGYDSGFGSWVRLLDSSNYSEYALAKNSWNGNLYFNNDGRIYATILYDSNDSGYYCDPNSNSRLNEMHANYHRSYGNARIDSHLYMDQNHGSTIVGVYSSYRLQGVWSMGDAYKISLDGTSSGNLYGLAWSHPNAGGQAGYLTNHGLIHMMYGTAFATISDTIWCRGDIIAYSDIRVKTNIEPIEDAVAKVMAIRGVTFNRTDFDDKGKRHAGVIAQEILEVLPEVVTQNSDNGHYSVSYGNISALLIEAIKEQQQQILELKNEIKKLKGE